MICDWTGSDITFIDVNLFYQCYGLNLPAEQGWLGPAWNWPIKSLTCTSFYQIWYLASFQIGQVTNMRQFVAIRIGLSWTINSDSVINSIQSTNWGWCGNADLKKNHISQMSSKHVYRICSNNPNLKLPLTPLACI